MQKSQITFLKLTFLLFLIKFININKLNTKQLRISSVVLLKQTNNAQNCRFNDIFFLVFKLFI